MVEHRGPARRQYLHPRCSPGATGDRSPFGAQTTVYMRRTHYEPDINHATVALLRHGVVVFIPDVTAAKSPERVAHEKNREFRDDSGHRPNIKGCAANFDSNSDSAPGVR